ncbi:hypothetical protein AVEN_195905-1 [Araneus ventricosus]|uniref:Uncharacterized protein n=1 Tax=Araneus ventricosus TaxID=182803 RepID=A0A4Y2JRA5_ARAVE|nr:hypothetical protein AVEN_195905-1 [Araneus ventricosus]
MYYRRREVACPSPKYILPTREAKLRLLIRRLLIHELVVSLSGSGVVVKREELVVSLCRSGAVVKREELVVSLSGSGAAVKRE